MSRIDKAKELYEMGVKPHIIQRRLGLSQGQMGSVTQSDQPKRFTDKHSYLSVQSSDGSQWLTKGEGFRAAKNKCKKNRWG